MLKKYIYSILFIGLAITGKAQHFNIGIGPEFNFPSGNSSNLSSVGLGGGVKMEYGFQTKYSISLSGSYVSFLGRDYFGNRTPSIQYIPLKAGFKYYPDKNFYLEAQGGVALPMDAGRNPAATWSPGIGTFIPMRGGSNKIDVGIRYEGIVNFRYSALASSNLTTFGFVGLRVAYIFSL